MKKRQEAVKKNIGPKFSNASVLSGGKQLSADMWLREPFGGL